MSSESEAPISAFDALPLRDELLSGLAHLGYEQPTPIQREAIPPLIEGRDVLGQAATGTGKTAAFALPLLNRLAPGDRGVAPSALVLVPTRELAMQVSAAVGRYGRNVGARVVTVYGGEPIYRQRKALKAGVDVVVATPGRAVDHINRGSLDLSHVAVLVLDEADEMLDMGFAEDLDAIIGQTPQARQTALFSATLPARVHHLARAYLNAPIRIELADAAGEVDGEALVRHAAYFVPEAHKPAALGRILDVEMPTAAIVFCRTRADVDELTQIMNGRGYHAEALHGGMDQNQRDRVLRRLRGETAELLIATDVAARGLDIDHLSHVVNYDLPSAPQAYVHRTGRVGRAGRTGVAITLAEPRQRRRLKMVERHTGAKITISSVPTIAELRARRLEVTRAAVRETLLAQDYDHVRAVVESLSDEFDLSDIALAAVKFAHESGGASSDEEELPAVVLQGNSHASSGPRSAGDHGGNSNGDRSGNGQGRRAPGDEHARIYVGLGRSAGIRPKDLVGAIAGESSLSGRDVGAIEITQRFSLVDVPQANAAEVIGALRRTTIKGRKASVRPDRDTTSK